MADESKTFLYMNNFIFIYIPTPTKQEARKIAKIQASVNEKYFEWLNSLC